VYTHLSASDTRDSGQAWNEGGSDEAMMTVKDGVRRGMRVKQLAKVWVREKRKWEGGRTGERDAYMYVCMYVYTYLFVGWGNDGG